MSDGIRDAYAWLGPDIKVDTGHLIVPHTGYTVYPNDSRWTTDDDEITQKIDIVKLWKEWEKEVLSDGCECGAASTPNWNCHSTWCPRYKPFK